MKMFFARGRCNYCLLNKKVLKFESPTNTRGLCAKCMEKLSKDKNLR